MAHFVTGVIAKPELLREFASEHSLRKPIGLGPGLAMVPLRHEDLERLVPAPTGRPDLFNDLSVELIDLLMRASSAGDVVYFETEYFGGDGAQGAAVFRNGRLLYGPRSAESGPINEALSIIGVVASALALDQFEEVGLHNHRSTDDWVDLPSENDA